MAVIDAENDNFLPPLHLTLRHLALLCHAWATLTHCHPIRISVVLSVASYLLHGHTRDALRLGYWAVLMRQQ